MEGQHNLTLDLGMRWQYLARYRRMTTSLTSFPIDTILQNVRSRFPSG
jgi:hypothetical protein